MDALETYLFLFRKYKILFILCGDCKDFLYGETHSELDLLLRVEFIIWGIGRLQSSSVGNDGL